MSKVLLSLFMLTLWGQLLIEKLRKSLGLPSSIRLFFVFSAVVWILVAQCCKRQENFLFFFSSRARVCFSVDYDHCTENCCRCANFFFSQRTAAICCSCADSGWDRLSSPPGRRELSCFSFKSSPSYDHLGSSTTEFAMRVLRKNLFCRTNR